MHVCIMIISNACVYVCVYTYIIIVFCLYSTVYENIKYNCGNIATPLVLDS